ncbi:MAG: ABC transporter permease [Anaerolineae bacterium]|nr:ABC transporter permease [Anaerolineae bacterium]
MAATHSETRSARHSRRVSLRNILVRWELLLVVLITVVTLINIQQSPFFLKPVNLSRAARDFMELGIMMLPMTYIIIALATVDLSVASIMGMCASFMGLLFMNGVDIWIAVAAALALGVAAGAMNGFLVAHVKLPALVVTLATYAFYRGMAYAMLGDEAARGYPESFTYLGQGFIGDGRIIPFSLILFLALALIFGVVLHTTTFGRYLYAIGNNEQAARYSGVPVDRVKMILFVLSGFMSALAGLVLAARFGSTRPDIGLGLELTVITATVLGGISISGGTGTMIGAILSLLLIGLVRFGMGLMNLQGQVQDIVIGLLLIISVLLPSIGRMLSRRGALSNLNVSQVLQVTLFVIAMALFVAFFLWSRSLL